MTPHAALPSGDNTTDFADGLWANLTTFRGGKVVHMVAYETSEAALAALELTLSLL
jgi:hypothetical protein